MRYRLVVFRNLDSLYPSISEIPCWSTSSPRSTTWLLAVRPLETSPGVNILGMGQNNNGVVSWSRWKLHILFASSQVWTVFRYKCLFRSCSLLEKYPRNSNLGTTLAPIVMDVHGDWVHEEWRYKELCDHITFPAGGNNSFGFFLCDTLALSAFSTSTFFSVCCAYLPNVHIVWGGGGV